MFYKAFKLIFLFVLGTVCHWAFATFFSFCGLSVNMMLVFAIAMCTIVPLEAGYLVAFFSGLFLDFFGARLFGNNAFLFTLAACAVYALRERIDFEAVVPQMVTVFLLTCTVGISNSLLVAWFTSFSQWPGLWSLLGGAVVGTFFAPFVFWLVRRVWGEETAPSRL